MSKLKYVVVSVALITQSISFPEVANAQLTGSYGSAGGQYSIPGATYQQRVYTPKDNNQISSEANNQNSSRNQKEKACAAGRTKLEKLRGKTTPAGSSPDFSYYRLSNSLRDQGCIFPY